MDSIRSIFKMADQEISKTTRVDIPEPGSSLSRESTEPNITHIAIGPTVLSSPAANQNPGSSGVPRMQSSNNNGKGVGRSRPSHKGSSSNSGKGKGPKSKKDASAVHELASSPASTDAISAIKSQLLELMGLVPIVKEIQTAFNACQEEESRVEMAEDDTFILPAPDSDDPEADDGMAYFNEVAGTSAPTGKAIRENIANGVEKVLCEGLPQDMQEKLGQKYLVPSNCTRLEVIPCDSEVFKNSNAKAKTRDSSLQSVQKYLMKGLTAVIFAFDALSNSDARTATEMLADGVTLLANGSHKLDVFRRHAFKGDMKDEYSSICNGSYPVKGSLFGPDMHERIREVNESLRVARSTRRFQPYQKPQKRFPFLGVNKGWRRRGGGTGMRGDYTPPPQKSSWGQQRRTFPRKK